MSNSKPARLKPVELTPVRSKVTTFRAGGKPQRVHMDWAAVIRTARLGAGYSRRELAFLASCSPSTLARIEQGKHTSSRSGGWTNIYFRLFKALGMELTIA